MPAFHISMRGIRNGVRKLAPVSIFVVPFGMAFGAAAVAHGMERGRAVLSSAVVFAGAALVAAAVMRQWQRAGLAMIGGMPFAADWNLASH